MNYNIRPSADVLTQPFWRALASGQLQLEQCTACGAFRHPPGPICPRCRSFGSRFVPASGRGVLHSFTEVQHAVHPSLAARVPYIVTLVDLDEGVRMVSGIQGVPAARLRVGMPLQCTVVRVDAQFSLPFFQPLP